MKKIHFVLSLILIISFYACKPDDPPKPNNPDTSLADAAAGVETYMTLTTSCPACVTPFGQVAILVVASVSAAQASGQFGRISNEENTYGKNFNILLDSNYVLPDNPFENTGKIHNEALNYLNKLPDLFSELEKLKNYDNLAWNKILKVVYSDADDSERNYAIEILKDANVFSILENKVTAFYQNGNDPFKTYIENSSFSPEERPIIQSIVDRFKYLLSTEIKTDEYDYINSEMSNILRSEKGYSTQEIAKLVFLTILKHSTYYWNN